MKAYHKIKSFSFILFALFLTVSCTKDFQEENTNPALVSEELVAPEFLLSGVQYGIKGGMAANFQSLKEPSSAAFQLHGTKEDI